MQYSLLVYRSAAEFARRADPSERAAFWETWASYFDALRAAGVLVGGAGLQEPARAVTLRLRNGRRLVEDGPYAETKEQLGGVIVIDVPDIADAVAWMWRCPGVLTGEVELRPHWTISATAEPAGAAAGPAGHCPAVTAGQEMVL
ncbi:MAG TPA: YciI family protein [Terriglobia bacterium]|nr:YciI family protein [Terriglobia bacterium]